MTALCDFHLQATRPDQQLAPHRRRAAGPLLRATRAQAGDENIGVAWATAAATRTRPTIRGGRSAAAGKARCSPARSGTFERSTVASNGRVSGEVRAPSSCLSQCSAASNAARAAEGSPARQGGAGSGADAPPLTRARAAAGPGPRATQRPRHRRPLMPQPAHASHQLLAALAAGADIGAALGRSVGSWPHAPERSKHADEAAVCGARTRSIHGGGSS
jgi:hypothetical protein